MYLETLSAKKTYNKAGLCGRALGVAMLFCLFIGNSFAKNVSNQTVITWYELPVEARQTISLIRRGGPFPYPRDGVMFGNHEGVLPKQKRGYYHEFTVKTPGTGGRGARRIVVGGDTRTSGELYYTSNHYATFSRIKE